MATSHPIPSPHAAGISSDDDSDNENHDANLAPTSPRRMSTLTTSFSARGTPYPKTATTTPGYDDDDFVTAEAVHPDEADRYINASFSPGDSLGSGGAAPPDTHPTPPPLHENVASRVDSTNTDPQDQDTSCSFRAERMEDYQATCEAVARMPSQASLSEWVDSAVDKSRGDADDYESPDDGLREAPPIDPDRADLETVDDDGNAVPNAVAAVLPKDATDWGVPEGLDATLFNLRNAGSLDQEKLNFLLVLVNAYYQDHVSRALDGDMARRASSFGGRPMSGMTSFTEPASTANSQHRTADSGPTLDMDAVDEAIRGLASKFGSVSIEEDESQEDVLKKLPDLLRTLRSLPTHSENEEMERRVSEMETILYEQTNVKEALEAEVSTLRSKLRDSSPESSSKNLKAQLSERDQQLKDLDAEVCDQELLRRDLQSALDDAHERLAQALSDMKQHRDRADEELTHRRNAIEELQVALMEKQKDLEVRDRAVADLESALTESQQSQADLSAKNGRLADLESDLLDSDSRLDVASSRNTELEAKLLKADASLRDHIDELAKLKNELAAREEIVAKHVQSEHHWKDQAALVERELNDLRDGVPIALDANAGEAFIRRLSSKLSSAQDLTNGNTLEALLKRVEELVQERDDFEKSLASMKENLSMRDREMEHFKESHAAEVAVLKEERERLAIIARVQEQRKESLGAQDDTLSIRSFNSTSSFADPIRHESDEGLVQSVVEAVGAVVADRDKANEKYREIVSRVTSAFERIECESFEVAEEFRQSQDELLRLIESQQGIVDSLARENKMLLHRQKDLSDNKDGFSLLEAHVAQLRTMWQDELAKNAEMRKVLMSQASRTNSPEVEKNKELNRRIEHLELECRSRSGEVEQWVNWLNKVEGVVGSYMKMYVALNNPRERVESAVRHLVSEASSSGAALSAAKKSNERLQGVGQCLVHQKKSLLWMSAFNGGYPPETHAAGSVLSGLNKLRAAALVFMWAARISRVRELCDVPRPAGEPLLQRPALYPPVPRPMWKEHAQPKLPTVLAAAAFPKIEAALRERTARLHEVEGTLATMHVRLAEAEGRGDGAVRAKETMVAALIEERDRLAAALERDRADAREARAELEKRLRDALDDQEAATRRLTSETYAKELADQRLDRYRQKLKEREQKYENLKRDTISRERLYKDALSSLKSKVGESGSPSGALDESETRDLRIIRELLGREDELVSASKSTRRPGASTRVRKIMDDVLDRQEKAGAFLEKVIRSVEAELPVLDAETGGETACDNLHEQIDSLRRITKRLRSSKR